MRIVVADGGSTDGSRAIVERIAARDPRIVLLDNPKRIQSAGVNLAARLYGEGCDFMLRVDAHARYPNRFCERLLAIQAKTGADSVVVAMRTVGRTCFERAAAAATKFAARQWRLGPSQPRRRAMGRPRPSRPVPTRARSAPSTAMTRPSPTTRTSSSTCACASATSASISPAACRSIISRAAIRWRCTGNTAASAAAAPATCSNIGDTPSRATSSSPSVAPLLRSRPARAGLVGLRRAGRRLGARLPRLRRDDRLAAARSLRHGFGRRRDGDAGRMVVRLSRRRHARFARSRRCASPATRAGDLEGSRR